MPASRTAKATMTKKASTDEPKPKRAPSAYSLFYKEQYALMKAEVRAWVGVVFDSERFRPRPGPEHQLQNGQRSSSSVPARALH